MELWCRLQMTTHRRRIFTETLMSSEEISLMGPNGVTGGSKLYVMRPPMAFGGVMAMTLAFSSGVVSM